jgi:plasmid stability protein
MATITLKKVPPELHRELKNRALAHHRSLSKEVIATLQGVTAITHRLDTQAMVRSHWSTALQADHRRNGNRPRAPEMHGSNGNTPVGYNGNGSEPLEHDDES